jgi:hypothetical protein
MEKQVERCSVDVMKTREIFSVSMVAAFLLFGGFCARAQSSYIEYRFIFSGTAYQTNAAGKMVATHITDQTLLKSRADQGNITNLNTVAIVYHLGGDPLGDTVEIASLNGARPTSEFGFFFGSDGSLGRTAVGTFDAVGQRRIDPLYTFFNSKYTYSNPDSVGSAFTYKPCEGRRR